MGNWWQLNRNSCNNLLRFFLISLYCYLYIQKSILNQQVTLEVIIKNYSLDVKVNQLDEHKKLQVIALGVPILDARAIQSSNHW